MDTAHSDATDSSQLPPRTSPFEQVAPEDPLQVRLRWGRIPGLGPVRRKLLESAGINSRVKFARLTVEQVVSLTGMGRAQAEYALQSVQNARANPLPSVVESDDPLAPDSGAEPPATAGIEEDATEGANAPLLPHELPPGRLDAAVFRLRTAASDLTRHEPVERLAKPLERLLATVDNTVTQSPQIRPKNRRALADLLERLAQRLERAALRSEKEPLSPRRVERLRKRIREARRLAQMLSSKGTARNKEAVI